MDKTKDKIDRYISLLKNDIDIEMIIIFGSYLSNTYKKYESDIDILIVSDDFNNMTKLDAYKLLSKPLWDIKINIDPISVTREEIENHENASFLSEILKTGKVIFKKTA